MRTIETTLYTARELKEHCPEGFEHAFSDYQLSVRNDPAWVEETCQSLKELVKATSGVQLEDWKLGAYCHSNLDVRFQQDGASELSGSRAMAWLENNLLRFLRVPWTGSKRKELRKYGSLYRPGLIKPCPFTGYYADEVFLDALRLSIKQGRSLKEAFEDLADTCRELLEQDIESQSSEESFLEHAEINELEFTEFGDRH